MSRPAPAKPAFFYGRKLREYDLNYQMITTDDGLRAICEAASSAPAVALDTEFVRTRTYYPQLGFAAAVRRQTGFSDRSVDHQRLGTDARAAA